MLNILVNMCEKFHCNWLRNDRALGNRKSDNKNPKNNNEIKNRSRTTFVAIGDPFLGPISFSYYNILLICYCRIILFMAVQRKIFYVMLANFHNSFNSHTHQ